MKAEALKQLAVVSIEQGTKLGYVDDVLFDTGRLCMAGFWVKTNAQRHLVPLSEVRAVGNDAVTVPRDEVVLSAPAASDLAGLPGLDQMAKLKVVDEAGTYIGKVSELDVDPVDYRITSVKTHEGGVLGIGGTTRSIASADIRSIGPEVMVVATAPAPQ